MRTAISTSAFSQFERVRSAGASGLEHSFNKVSFKVTVCEIRVTLMRPPVG